MTARRPFEEARRRDGSDTIGGNVAIDWRVRWRTPAEWRAIRRSGAVTPGDHDTHLAARRSLPAGRADRNPHFHTLVLDGVFVDSDDGELVFHPAPPPSDREVAELLAIVHRRIVRLLERRGLLPDEPDPDETDDLFERSPALAGCYSASTKPSTSSWTA